MGLVILTVLAGSLFIFYEKYRNKRRRQKTPFYNDSCRVIQLPEDLEKEKRRRHIH